MKKLFKRIIAKIRAGLLKLCKGVPAEDYDELAKASAECEAEYSLVVENFCKLHTSYIYALDALASAFFVEKAPDGRHIYNNGICAHCMKEGQEMCRECQGISKFVFKHSPHFMTEVRKPGQEEQRNGESAANWWFRSPIVTHSQIFASFAKHD